MKKQVFGYEGRYEIDQNGNIWSCRIEKIVNGRLYAWADKRLSPFLDSNEYLYVNLGDVKNIKKHPIHRLVLCSFVGPPNKKQVACHYDGNKLNNSLSNLRWDSYARNYADSVRHGTCSIGSRHNCAKLKEHQVFEILASKEPSTTICKKYNVASSTIRAIRIKQNWKHIS